MDSAQIYETTIYNRDRRGQAFTFLTLPRRSLPNGEVPTVERVAEGLSVLFMDNGPRASGATCAHGGFRS
jgi:hypothetical protein